MKSKLLIILCNYNIFEKKKIKGYCEPMPVICISLLGSQKWIPEVCMGCCLF